MTDASDAPYDTDVLPSATDLWRVDPNAVVDEWTDEHDPLSREELSTLGDEFVRTVGEPAHVESETNVTEDEYLRAADADAFGRFAFERGVAILEPGDGRVDPEYGYLYGYTANANSPEDRGVPLLVCLPGPPSEAAAWLEAFSAAVAEMPGLGIVRP